MNVSARRRELATIKVPGFFDKEVTDSIVRENVICWYCSWLGGLVNY
ncbi:hypothetical protein [Latilactobacillus graminis]|nr:hypothetical protein [Latilactobacillus graminis]